MCEILLVLLVEFLLSRPTTTVKARTLRMSFSEKPVSHQPSYTVRAFSAEHVIQNGKSQMMVKVIA